LRLRGRIVALCALGASVAACADLLGFKDLRQSDAGVDGATPPDASGDVAPPDAGGDVVDTCPHVRWPDPPDASDPGSPNDYVLALHHMYLSSSPDGGVPSFGYDLDRRCTTDQASASCQSASLVTDGVGGVDNGSIQLLGTLSSLVPSLDDSKVNATIAAGQFTILLHVFGLRSLGDQTATTGLKVAVQASPGMEFGGTPAFAGTDRWLVAEEDTVGGGSNFPKLVTSAYVSNGVLVSTMTGQISLRLLLPAGNTVSGPLLVTLSDPVLTANLTPATVGDAGAVGVVSGVVVGRWKAADMLGAIAPLTVNGGSLCDYLDGGALDLVKQEICPIRDITSSGTDDGTSACDAVSVAVAFDAVPAEMATTPVPFPASATPCTRDAGACDD